MIFYLRARANWVEPQRIKQELLVSENRHVQEMTREELLVIAEGSPERKNGVEH